MIINKSGGWLTPYIWGRFGISSDSCTRHKVLKSLSDTPYEAHTATTGAVLESSEIADAVESIAEDQSQKGDTAREAASLAGKMQELEFVLMLVCLA